MPGVRRAAFSSATFSGVAPMLIYLADRDETVSIAGLGWWPKALNIETFIRDHNGNG